MLADAFRAAVSDALLDTLYATSGLRALATDLEHRMTEDALPVTVAAG
jgi:hypothetical protein